VLVSFCSCSALADDFGLGTAGPGNWGILETDANQVSLSNGTGITVNSGASASQANLGINSGGNLNQSGTVVVQGTYYKFSGNNDSTTSGFTAVGGVNTTSTGTITTAAMQALSRFFEPRCAYTKPIAWNSLNEHNNQRHCCGAECD
jgi:hypothetical protein